MKFKYCAPDCTLWDECYQLGILDFRRLLVDSLDEVNRERICGDYETE